MCRCQILSRDVGSWKQNIEYVKRRMLWFEGRKALME